MMETKDPIELLFDLCERLAEHRCNDEYVQILLGVKDEIEAKYMRLPVDADGVPLRPGDEIEYDDPFYEFTRRCIVEGVCESSVFTDESYEYIAAYNCRHVKPDTVESLLQELADEVWNASCECQTTWSDSGLDGIAERYAERIREAVEP